MGELLGLPRHDVERVTGWLDRFLERNEMHPPDKALADAEEASAHLVEHITNTPPFFMAAAQPPGNLHRSRDGEDRQQRRRGDEHVRVHF